MTSHARRLGAVVASAVVVGMVLVSSESCPVCVAAVQAKPSEKAGKPNMWKSWRLEWDDHVDGVLKPDAKTCDLMLKMEEGKVEGTFNGPVEGKSRDAKFEGDVFAPKETALLLIRQTEGSYVCGYQMQIEKDGGYAGVWHDNKGRSGDCRVHYYPKEEEKKK